MDSSFSEVDASNVIRSSKAKYFLVKMPKDFDLKTLHKTTIDFSGGNTAIKDNHRQYYLSAKKNISSTDAIFRPIVHDQTVDAAAVGPSFSGTIQIRQFFSTSSGISSPDAVPQVLISARVYASLFLIKLCDVFRRLEVTRICNRSPI